MLRFSDEKEVKFWNEDYVNLIIVASLCIHSTSCRIMCTLPSRRSTRGRLPRSSLDSVYVGYASKGLQRRPLFFLNSVCVEYASEGLQRRPPFFLDSYAFFQKKKLRARASSQPAKEGLPDEAEDLGRIFGCSQASFWGRWDGWPAEVGARNGLQSDGPYEARAGAAVRSSVATRRSERPVRGLGRLEWPVLRTWRSLRHLVWSAALSQWAFPSEFPVFSPQSFLYFPYCRLRVPLPLCLVFFGCVVLEFCLIFLQPRRLDVKRGDL